MEERYDTVSSLAKRTLNIELPDTHASANRALFVFSENNLIRKAARNIIEWGYPFHGYDYLGCSSTFQDGSEHYHSM
ncbi:hypothetical protein CRM22_009263 [Opisthorchis felineus]|nr:hypothetical protein CRM22_009263 [Opisthorchis felineus]